MTDPYKKKLLEKMKQLAAETLNPFYDSPQTSRAIRRITYPEKPKGSKYFFKK